MKPRRLKLTCTVFNDLVRNSHRTDCLHCKYEANAVRELSPLHSEHHKKYRYEIYGESAFFFMSNAVVHAEN